MDRAITLMTDVKDLGELLAGARVEQAKMVQAGGRLQLLVELVRAMPERQHVIRRGLFQRAKTPWTKCQLTLTGVQSLTVKRLEDLGPDQTPLLVCEAVSGGYQLTIQAPDGLQLVLGLERLEGAFADVGSPIESP